MIPREGCFVWAPGGEGVELPFYRNKEIDKGDPLPPDPSKIHAILPELHLALGGAT